MASPSPSFRFVAYPYCYQMSTALTPGPQVYSVVVPITHVIHSVVYLRLGICFDAVQTNPAFVVSLVTTAVDRAIFHSLGLSSAIEAISCFWNSPLSV
jgi:hypothetical protein